MIPGIEAAHLCELLRRHVRGRVLGETDAGYAAARRLWNAHIDRCPAAIVACGDEHDVIAALAVARDHGVAVSVRGGGHGVGGLAARDDAVMLDLSALRTVSISAERRSALVGGGALWRDLDAAAARQGLATTGGLVSSTGVGGLTLGGGTGWLMRRHGLACDNLLGARVVLSDGRVLELSAQEEPDLWWLARGGAGQFGVVTALEFRLHPLEAVFAASLIYPASAAGALLRAFRDFAATAPDEFCGVLEIAAAPPLPQLERHWHGRTVVTLGVCWCGALAAGRQQCAPLLASAQPLAEVKGEFAYDRWQQQADATAPAGQYHYWRNATFPGLDEASIDLLEGVALRLPGPLTRVHLQHLGGAVERVPEQDSAFAGRQAQFFVNLIGAAARAEEFDEVCGWVRRVHGQLARGAQPEALSNFDAGADEAAADRLTGRRERRVQELRRRCDPWGVFAPPLSGASALRVAAGGSPPG